MERPGPYVEGPGGHGRGEVDEAAVAERQQVVRHLPHAVGDVEVDVGGGAGVRRVAVEHHQRESVPWIAASASAAMEEAITPSSAARAEAKGSLAGPVPSGEG